jgi:succinate-semialdehyde dehydrogenase / glutarate-semialdehyde dehydrogenase
MNETQVLDSVPRELYIDGTWRESSTAARLDVEDPATADILSSVSDASAEDAVRALDAAAAAQEDWAATAPRFRAEILRAAYELLIQRTDEFALLMTMEMGKPLSQAKGEVAYSADFLRWFSEEAVRIDGRWTTAPDGKSRLLTMKGPVGPTLMILPWNFPLAMGARKIAPAIAAGCTMVVKPASQTPLTTLAFAQLLHEVGVPAGVLNVITTSRTSELMPTLLADSRLRKLSFTGSTEIGRTLVRQSAGRLLKVSMELGGNAPFLVFADADLDAAVEGAMVAKMRNMGEACTAANRFFVHESVAEEFTTRLAERMSAERLGRGTEDGVTVGPLIDAKAQRAVSNLVEDARNRGASVVCGGSKFGERGYFFEPTVLTDVPFDADVFRDEIFGPVAPVATFATDTEAIRRANDTDYGLAAYVFTKDVARVLKVGEALQFGIVGINQGLVSNAAAPFGGVKQSGFGREGGREGIEDYLSIKYLGIAT